MAALNDDPAKWKAYDPTQPPPPLPAPLVALLCILLVLLLLLAVLLLCRRDDTADAELKSRSGIQPDHQLSRSGRWSLSGDDGSRLHLLTKFGSWGRGTGELLNPRFLLPLENSVLVADSGNDRLQIFSADGTPKRVILGSRPGHPTGLATDGVHIWVADSSNCSVAKVRLPDGSDVLRTGSCARHPTRPRHAGLEHSQLPLPCTPVCTHRSRRILRPLPAPNSHPPSPCGLQTARMPTSSAAPRASPSSTACSSWPTRATTAS